MNTGGANSTVAVEVTGWAGAGAPPSPTTAVDAFVVSSAGMAASETTLGALVAPEGVALGADSVAFWRFVA
jgi:hypothetical protein